MLRRVHTGLDTYAVAVAILLICHGLNNWPTPFSTTSINFVIGPLSPAKSLISVISFDYPRVNCKHSKGAAKKLPFPHQRKT
jgi:hypothetical protein